MRNIVLSIVFFYIGTAQAQSLSSEYLFQPSAKQSYLQVSFENNITKLELSSNRFYSPLRTLLVNYEYGVLNNLSLYGNISYLKGTSLEISADGVGPINLGAKYSHEFGKGLLFTKFNVLAAVDGKYRCESSRSCTASDSAIGTTLQLAYLWRLNNANTGLSLRYGLFSTDAKSKGGDDAEKKGTLNLSAFYERGFGDNLYGFTLTYLKDDGLLGSSSNYPYMGYGFIIKGAGANTDALALKSYVKTSLSETLQLIPAIEYSRVLSSELESVSSKTSSLILAIRLRKLL